LDALASAAEEGGCFMHMKEVTLCDNQDITDSGLLTLCKAISAGCMPKLAGLTIGRTGMDMSGGSAVALLCILLDRCPDFQTLTLPKHIESNARKVIEGILLNRGRSFHRIFPLSLIK
jgi:hypothetical protein